MVSFPSRADQHHPEQFVNTLKVSAQPAPPTVTDLAADFEVHQPLTSLTPLPSCSSSSKRPLSTKPNDTVVQTQGSLTPSQRVLVVLPCSAGSCLTDYRTISSAAAAES